jgi:ribosomal-protein-alanine N-acetyltransferase
VHAIERAAFSDPWSAGQLRECLAAGLDFLVAERDGSVVGYVVAVRAADEAEILNLCVAPTARRAGTGRALVRAILQRVATRGARAAYLEVRESNRAARRLYEAEGFAAVGRRRDYYRRPVEDAIVLRSAILTDRPDA